MNTKYGFGKTVESSFDAAVEKVTQELQKEGFGILADIDVADTLKKKLNQDMPPYRILGACNPPLAHRALEAEPSIGLLLPCNVVVRQDETGKVHVEFMDPNAVLDMVNKPEISQLASEVRQKLERVMEALVIAAPDARQGSEDSIRQMQERMHKMQAQMDKIYQTEDTEERQKLMQEHMGEMRENMKMMQGMTGGEKTPHGKCNCCGR
jgi:uncharacterized protein (DUF302 family)